MGIVDAQGNEVVQPGSSMWVIDITGKLALVQLERKFLFVPLDQGFVSSEALNSVDGFQYAEPYRCGLAMVSINDSRFYIGSNFEKAFASREPQLRIDYLVTENASYVKRLDKSGWLIQSDLQRIRLADQARAIGRT